MTAWGRGSPLRARRANHGHRVKLAAPQHCSRQFPFRIPILLLRTMGHIPPRHPSPPQRLRSRRVNFSLSHLLTFSNLLSMSGAPAYPGPSLPQRALSCGLSLPSAVAQRVVSFPTLTTFHWRGHGNRRRTPCPANGPLTLPSHCLFSCPDPLSNRR
jgi:hypothetical protein